MSVIQDIRRRLGVVKEETYTGPRDSWELVWDCVKHVLDTTEDEMTREMVQKAYDSIIQEVR